jgi:uncharacterized membrane protein
MGEVGDVAAKLVSQGLQQTAAEEKVMVTIALAVFLIVIGMIAVGIGIYQLGTMLFGLVMLAGGIWFIGMGIYGLEHLSVPSTTGTDSPPAPEKKP